MQSSHRVSFVCPESIWRPTFVLAMLTMMSAGWSSSETPPWLKTSDLVLVLVPAVLDEKFSKSLSLFRFVLVALRCQKFVCNCRIFALLRVSFRSTRTQTHHYPPKNLRDKRHFFSNFISFSGALILLCCITFDFHDKIHSIFVHCKHFLLTLFSV